MRYRLIITAGLGLLIAAAARGDVQIIRSTTAECVWDYLPGAPITQRDDTINLSGVMLGWSDNDYRISENYVQPVRVFQLVVPPGTTPLLSVQSVQIQSLSRGLAAAPPEASKRTESTLETWAVLDRVHDWRGFRLARILVPLQRGTANQSEILVSARITVRFTGTIESLSNQARDGDLLQAIAINGAIADHWWTDTRNRATLDDVYAWPEFPLQRIAVTETGLYQVTGSSLAGSAIVGQPLSRIKLFGNGGGLLPKNPDTPTDATLIENAVRIEDLSGNGVFDAEDRILFFGKGLKGADYCDETYLNGLAHHSPFAVENVYFLGADPAGTDGLRMQSIPTTGTGTAVSRTWNRQYRDQDAFIYATGLQTESGLVWMMSTIGPQQERTFSLNLEGAVGTAGFFRADMESVGYVGQNFNIYIGNTRIDSLHFTTAPFTIPVAAGVLAPGDNVVRLQNASSATVHVNYVEVEYERELSAPSGTLTFFAPEQTGSFRYVVGNLESSAMILDISDPLHPRLAAGNTIVDSSYESAPREYFAVRSDLIRSPVFRGTKILPDLDYTSLRSASNPGGIILLTFDDWYDALDSLKLFHETYREEPLPAVRVRIGDVFDEFGWGVRDPVAIRNFLKYAYYNWHGPSGTDTLKYVLFVGDGDYDYRNIESQADANWMPPWEYNSECTDDFFSLFTNASDLPWLLTGRWPLQSRGEVEAAVSKTIAYANSPLYTPWKNTATFTADDEYKNGCDASGEPLHTIQAENLINSVLPEYFTFKKIYEIFYPMKNTTGGTIKPDATRDLLEAINRGTLIVNYAGHGNEHVWTDEQLFVMDRDNRLLENYRMWPLFLAATCSWGGFDKPLSRCYPEVLLTDVRSGSIASVAATRFTFSGSNDVITNAFYGELFRQGINSRRSFGRGMLVAKATRATNADLYHVFGDPVLRLATPEYFARVTSADDSLRALSLYHLSGEILREAGGPVWSDFNGVVEVRVFDTEDSTAYYWCGNTASAPYYIGLPGNAIFRGTATVVDGLFDVTFRVPRDVRYGGNNAKISLYYFGKSETETDSADGIGIREHIPIATQASIESDSIPPQITFWLESPSFRAGDLVSASPKLHVDIYDSSGINLSGEVGHKVTVRIDDAQAEDLTAFFNYDLDSHTAGQLEKVIGPLTEGEHRLTIEAWDSFNNLNQISQTFRVGPSGEAGYAIRDVYNWPNPMSDLTYFTYYLTQDDTRRVSLKIFTLSGKLVYEMDGLGTSGPAFNSNSDRPWDGRDREGHMLANGVYFYRITAEHSDGHDAEATGKLVILR